MVQLAQAEVESMVASAQRGDREARSALVPQYGREVESAVVRYLASARPHELEDVAQDVWAKLLERFDRFDPTRGVKFSTWLYALARNHCFDVLKKRRLPVRSLATRSRDANDEDLSLDPADARSESPVANSAHSEFLCAYRAAARRLEADQREVFEMRALDGLEFNAIARQRRIPIGTAKSTYYRSVGKLQRALAGFGDGEGVGHAA